MECLSIHQDYNNVFQTSLWLSVCMLMHVLHVVHECVCTHASVRVWLPVTLLHVAGSFLNADDRVDFSCA